MPSLHDLRVAPGPGAPRGLVVPGDELVERFSHASGPGGQGVNTAGSGSRRCCARPSRRPCPVGRRSRPAARGGAGWLRRSSAGRPSATVGARRWTRACLLNGG